MLGGFLKKIFFGKSDKQKNTGEKFGSTLQKKSQEIYEVANKKYNQGIEEFFSIKKKLKNLLETNYALGMKHLEKGNLSDAIFRFRFIKRFWPHHYQTYYQLAYCLFLDNNPQEAEEVLEELIAKNPNCDQIAKDLLERAKATIIAQNAINKSETPPKQS